MSNDRDWYLAHQLHTDELIARARRGGLLSFTMLTKPDYEVRWHNQRIARALTKFVRKEIRRLIILAPPRHGKTELAARRLPALIHGMYPNDEILAMSYNSDLASDNTVDVQRIMDRPEYSSIFPNSRITPDGKLSKYARSKNEHELIPIQHPDRLWTFPQGSYRSAGLGGAFTGRGGNWGIIDDPIKNRQDADSKAYREQLWNFYSSTFRTRMEGFGSILLMMTTWHADDLAHRLINLMREDPHADQWEILRMPAIREDIEDPSDPRMIGEALWPEKFDIPELTALRANNERDFAALYQCHPTAEGGNIIKSDWIQRYESIPQKFDKVVISCDFAVKDKKGSDYNVIQVWGRLGANCYLLHQERGHWDFPLTCTKLVEVCRLWPSAHKKLIEAKANGPAVIQTLKSKINGLVGVEPRGDKIARLHAVAPMYQAGNVWYPSARMAPWINVHMVELTDFPNGVNDDQVDAATQALDELRAQTNSFLPIAGHGSGTIF